MDTEQEVWDALLQAYKENGIVLTLGAGVSRDSNIPSWEELLERIVVNTRTADKHSFKVLLKSHFPLPAVASFLAMNCGCRDDFVEQVREALYRDFPFRNVKIGSHNRRAFRRFIQEGYVEGAQGKYKPNLTMRSIGGLCLTKRPQANDSGKYRIVPNNRIRAIVTLNMDALLQTYVNSFVWKDVHILRTVESASTNTYSESISVYHLHGYLHFFPGEHKRDAPEKVVLTEQDYYDFFNRPNSMFNYTFLYLLREYSCLFIGLSMQDENIRRLLHYSKLEREQSIVEKRGKRHASSPKEQTRQRLTDDRKIKRHFAIMKKNEDLLLDQAYEKTLGALGVNLLWVKDFSEVPGLLGNLYKSIPEDGQYWAAFYDMDKNGKAPDGSGPA